MNVTSEIKGIINGVSPKNLSLYLEKYFSSEKFMEEGVKKSLVEEFALPKDYVKILKDQHILFSSTYGDRYRTVEAQLISRMMINMADSLSPNEGISLDRLTGAPFIPGSAVKGVSRHVAYYEKKKTSFELDDLFLQVFGDTSNDFQEKGKIAFLPAFPIDKLKLHVDMINPHRGEDCTPILFPCVDSGSRWLFRLVCMDNNLNDEDSKKLLDSAEEWLCKALSDHGVGAKISSGYGLFSVCKDAAHTQKWIEEYNVKMERLKLAEQAALEERLRAEERNAALALMSDLDRCIEELKALPNERFIDKLKSDDLDELSKEAFAKIYQTVKDKKDQLKTWREKKPKNAEIVDALIKLYPQQ